MFQLSTLNIGAFAVARFPRLHIRDTSPSLYADLLDFQARADIRIRIRGIVIRIRIRDTAIRVRIVVPAIDHTAYGNSTSLQSYSFSVQKMNEYYTMSQNNIAMKPPSTVQAQSIQSQGQP